MLLLVLTFCSELLLLKVVEVPRKELPVEDSFIDLTLGRYLILR